MNALIFALFAFVVLVASTSETKTKRIACFVGDEDRQKVRRGFTYCKGVYTLNEETVRLTGEKDNLGIEGFVFEDGEEEDDETYTANRSACEITVDKTTGQFQAICKCWKDRCNIPKQPKEMFKTGNFVLKSEDWKNKKNA